MIVTVDTVVMVIEGVMVEVAVEAVVEAVVDDITIERWVAVAAIPTVGVEAGDGAVFSNAVDEDEEIIVDEDEVVE